MCDCIPADRSHTKHTNISDTNSENFNLLQRFILVATISGFMFTSMIPIEIFIENEAFPLKTTFNSRGGGGGGGGSSNNNDGGTPHGLTTEAAAAALATTIDGLTSFFSYRLKSTAHISLKIQQIDWWMAMVPSSMLATAIIWKSSLNQMASMDVFTAMAIWWILAESVFLLKSVSTLVQMFYTHLWINNYVHIHWNIYLMGFVLIYYCAVFMYLSYELIAW